MCHVVHYTSSLSNWKGYETIGKTKTFVAITNATIIHILNSYYNFIFLIYNQTKEIIIIKQKTTKNQTAMHAVTDSLAISKPNFLLQLSLSNLHAWSTALGSMHSININKNLHIITISHPQPLHSHLPPPTTPIQFQYRIMKHCRIDILTIF